MINGKVYAWESISITAPHGVLYGVTKIDYKDKRGVNRIRGKGSRTRGYSRKGYEAEGTLEMDREEYEEMKKAFPNGIYSNSPFPITVSRAEEGKPTITDELQDCLFEEREFGISEGDESDVVKLGFIILGDIADGGTSPFPES